MKLCDFPEMTSARQASLLGKLKGRYDKLQTAESYLDALELSHL
jgi:hypothetical protein